jgi:uncharacterized membrane protein
VILESVVLMVWWLFQAQGESFAETWTLFSSFNIGTVLIQWGIALVVLFALNGWLASKSVEGRRESQTGEGEAAPEVT